MNTSDKVIKIAKAEDGYLEKKSNKYLDSKTKNAGDKNYTKYGAWYGTNGTYWCAMFVSWCFDKAYGTKQAEKLLYGSKSASCETLRKRFIDKKRYYKNPKVGDLIFFSGTRHSGANHIGIVTKVSSTKVYTIEGNTSSDSGVVDNGGAVNQKSYKRTYAKILGYGRPKYDIKVSATVEVKQAPSVQISTNTSTSVKKATSTKYYKKYTGKSIKIDKVFKAIGVPTKYYGSASKRKKIANANGIKLYLGTASQNKKLIELAKKGKLKKA